jgi:hypothetical protein
VARRTDGEKIDELEKLVAGILKELAALGTTVRDLDAAGKGTAQGLNDFRRDCETRIAVLTRDVAELRRWTEQNRTADLKSEIAVLKEQNRKLEAAQERAGNRVWSVVPNIVGAIVNGLIAAAVAYLVARG